MIQKVVRISKYGTEVRGLSGFSTNTRRTCPGKDRSSVVVLEEGTVRQTDFIHVGRKKRHKSRTEAQ